MCIPFRVNQIRIIELLCHAKAAYLPFLNEFIFTWDKSVFLKECAFLSMLLRTSRSEGYVAQKRGAFLFKRDRCPRVTKVFFKRDVHSFSWHNDTHCLNPHVIQKWGTFIF